MHWVLGLVFREDESRIREAQGPLAFNVMRKIEMASFKQDETKVTGMKAKNKVTWIDDDYRSSTVGVWGYKLQILISQSDALIDYQEAFTEAR
jgi:hypothetical protein